MQTFELVWLLCSRFSRPIDVARDQSERDRAKVRNPLEPATEIELKMGAAIDGPFACSSISLHLCDYSCRASWRADRDSLLHAVIKQFANERME